MFKLLPIFFILTSVLCRPEDHSEQEIKKEEDKSTEKELEKLFSDLKEGFQNIMKNVTSSNLYQEAVKIGSAMEEKGQNIVSKIQDQIQQLQTNNKNSS